jgi:hypothetical protein
MARQQAGNFTIPPIITENPNPFGFVTIKQINKDAKEIKDTQDILLLTQKAILYILVILSILVKIPTPAEDSGIERI